MKVNDYKMLRDHGRTIDFPGASARELVDIALAIETLGYHNANALDRELKDGANRSAMVQAILKTALMKMYEE